MKGNRKVITTILIVIACAAAAVGIGVAVRKTTSGGTVMVIPVDTINYNWYSNSSGDSVDGSVTTDATQNVYVTDKEMVEGVYVSQGDRVKKGDLLVKFDTEQAAIALAQREIELDQIKLSVDVANRNLETLRRIVPIYEGGMDGDMDEFDEEGEEDPENGGWEGEPYAVLDKDSTAYNDLKNSSAYNDIEESDTLGLLADPYRFLVYDDRVVTIKQEFIRGLIDAARKAGKSTCYITLEAHEENDPFSPISGDMKNYFMTDILLWEKVSGDLVFDFREAEPTLRPGGGGTDPNVEPTPDEMQDKIDELNKQVEELNAKIEELEKASGDTAAKDTKIAELEEKSKPCRKSWIKRRAILKKTSSTKRSPSSTRR